MENAEKLRVGIVGLGYVGLPLAVEFGKHFNTVGFDIKAERIAELRAGRDSTLECSSAELAEAKRLTYTGDLKALGRCTVFIITVPTPIDEYKRPDLTPLVKSSESVGKVLKKGDIVVQRVAVGCELVRAADGGPRFLLCFHSRNGEGLLCDCRFAHDVYTLSERSERLQSEGALHVDDRVLRMQAAALKHSKSGERVRNLDWLLNKTLATGVFVDPRACRLSRLEKV